MTQRPARRRQRRRRTSRRADNPAGAQPEAARSEAAGSESGDGGDGGRKRGERASPPAKRKDTIFGMPRLAFSLIAGLLVAMVAVFAMQLIFPNDRVAEVEGVEVYADQGWRQLGAGERFGEYNSFPPTSGPLPYSEAGPEAAAYGADGSGGECSVISGPEGLLPVLSRGGVVIYYDSEMDAGDLSAWYEAQRLSRQKLALAPLEGLRGSREDGAPIVAAAWRTLLPVQALDEDGREQLGAFIQYQPDGYYDRYQLDTSGIPACGAG